MQAKVSKSTPAQLFSEAVTGLSESILVKELRKKNHNQRTRSFPKVPDYLKDLKIEGMYVFTFNEIKNKEKHEFLRCNQFLAKSSLFFCSNTKANNRKYFKFSQNDYNITIFYMR